MIFSVFFSVSKPRYVRVNTLLLSVNEAVKNFESEGWSLVLEYTDYKSYLKLISNLSEPYFTKDYHIPELLVFPHGTSFFNHSSYKNGEVVLQDKVLLLSFLFCFFFFFLFYRTLYYNLIVYFFLYLSQASCLPSYLLNPPVGSVVLDMCAAPGMKSSHLAAILQNQGYNLMDRSYLFAVIRKEQWFFI